jgi:MoaA/NifB/PqqE/SkfB family radical SAM enzyme
MKVVPIAVAPAAPLLAERPVAAPAPSFESLTVMLTELCNLDCWMCDFAVSKGLREQLPWSSKELLAFLDHPYFARLHSIGFTGGEPFAHGGARQIYQDLVESRPELFISFSSNATLLKPMLDTFALTRAWNKTKLFTSIDGVETHDVQRGRAGALQKSMSHLKALRERFPELVIEVKFTVTPVNHEEVAAAYRLVTSAGFDFTAKMIEVNPNYTSQLSFESHSQDFQFTPAQIDTVRRQLDEILAEPSSAVSARRRAEMLELRESLEPGWKRSGRCTLPRSGAFIDGRLRLFTCKEYAPVLDLRTQKLEDLLRSPAYAAVHAAERSNAQACTRCTSQLKKRSRLPAWMWWAK